MNEYRNTPTCETGFWEPLHAGCPVCGPAGPCRDPEYEALIQANLARKQTFRTIRFFACLFISLVPLGVVALFDWLGTPLGRSNAGWAMVCTILLLSYVAWLGFRKEPV